MVEKKSAYRVAQIDDYVKHIFRDHNWEADHLANLETKGHGQVTIESVERADEWTAVKGYWDGSSGCGVDKEK